MQQLTSQALEHNLPQRPKTSIMVIGGAEDKVHGREILNTFFCPFRGYKRSAGDRALQLREIPKELATATAPYLTKWA